MAAIRRAEAVWEGDLAGGRGQVTTRTSGVFTGLPVTWASRTEKPDGRTSPEELLAAAHASCFAMALSHNLSSGGATVRRLEVSATVTFDKVEQGWKVKSSVLEVRGQVDGVDAQRFQRAAEEAKEGCPISQALKGNVELQVQASLASPG